MGVVAAHRPAGGDAAVARGLDDARTCLAVIGSLGCLGLPRTMRTERVRRSGIADVDVMPGAAFEERLCALYADLGFGVRRTGGTGDYGGDLLIERCGVRSVVQAKRYDGAVGIEAVQQVAAARRFYDADEAVVVTNSSCTPAATALAQANGVHLVERPALIALLAAHPRGGRQPRPCGLLARQVAAGAWLTAVLVFWALRAVSRVALSLCGLVRALL